jgi:hypothetical protein
VRENDRIKTIRPDETQEFGENFHQLPQSLFPDLSKIAPNLTIREKIVKRDNRRMRPKGVGMNLWKNSITTKTSSVTGPAKSPPVMNHREITSSTK